MKKFKIQDVLFVQICDPADSEYINICNNYSKKFKLYKPLKKIFFVDNNNRITDLTAIVFFYSLNLKKIKSYFIYNGGSFICLSHGYGFITAKEEKINLLKEFN